MLQVKRFKDTFPTYDEFLKGVITPCRENFGDLEWLNDQPKYYKLKSLYFVLRNAYGERIQYHDGEEFLGYFNNIFVQVTPTYFARIQQLITDKIAELQDISKAGKGSSLTSESNRAQSTSPFGNYVSQLDNVDGQQQSLYKLNNSNENLIEVAARLSSIRINGEIQKYVASFAQLFTKSQITEPVKYDFFKDVVDTLNTYKAVSSGETIPKYYDSRNKFYNESQLGEIGRITQDNGHGVLLLKLSNGVTEEFYNVEEMKEYIAAEILKLQQHLQIEITNNQNDILGLIESAFSNKYLDKAYADAANGIISNNGTTLVYVRDFTTVPKDGDIGELHLENADGTISFNLPFKMNGSITTTFYKGENDKDQLTVLVNSQDIIITATKNGFFTDNGFKLTKAYGNSSSIDTSLFLTRVLGNTLYESKTNDYSNSDSILSLNTSGGKRYQIIPMAAGVDKFPVNSQVKLKVVASSDAVNLPQDGDQVTYGVDLIWIDKAKTDIMSWSEIKDNVGAGKSLVIKKIADGEWELVRWESQPNPSVVDLTSIVKSDVLYAALTKLNRGDIVKLTRKRGDHIFLAMVGAKGNGKMVDTDAAAVDYITINAMTSSEYSFLGQVKIPNRDEDWDTHYGSGDAYLFQDTPGNINIGYGNGGWIRIGESAKGILDIGSTTYVDGDDKGKLIHGSKSATFEKIINVASLTPTLITFTADDNTVVNGILLV